MSAFVMGVFVGAFIGGTVGVLTMAMLTAGKLSDLEDKIALLKRQLGSDPSSKFYPAALLFRQHN